MATVKIDTTALLDIFEVALADSVMLLEDKIKSITPRDPARPPKNPEVPVTGNLKRSIAHKQVDKLKFIIGTVQDKAEYGRYLEFGTMHMQSRSFLRLGIERFGKEVVNNFVKNVKRKLKGK